MIVQNLVRVYVSYKSARAVQECTCRARVHVSRKSARVAQE